MSTLRLAASRSYRNVAADTTTASVPNAILARHLSGFQGPNHRGMGKEGGGKGDGGSHRSPKGGGAFAEFRAKRVAALKRDLEAAKEATAAEGKPPVRPSTVQSTQQDTHHRPGRVPHRGGPPKENFADKVLKPASKGNLPENEGGGGPKHTSGIPKLIHRKPIGHQVHDAEQLSSAGPVGQRRSGRASVRGEMSLIQGDLGRMDRFANVPPPLMPERERSRGRNRTYLQQQHSNPAMALDQDKTKMNQYLGMNHYAFNVDNQDDDGYDSDADLEPVCGPEDPDYMDLESHEHVRKGEDKFIFDMDSMMELTPEEQAQSIRDGRFRRDVNPEDIKPWENTYEYNWYYRDVTNLDDDMLLEPLKPVSNAMLPLRPHGPKIDDFIEAAHDHPSRFITMEKKFVHTDSKREPQPIFPKGRTHPDEEFVNGHKGFLYVTGLVPQIDDATGAVKDFEDPLHKNSIADTVSKLFGVNALDVSPASSTSAFVGFATKLDAKNAMMNCENLLSVKHPTKIDKYEAPVEFKSNRKGRKEKYFVGNSSPESILKITGIPPGVTSAELFQTLFPPGTKLDAMFGPLGEDDYLRLSDTAALVRLASPDLVSKALKASGIANNAAVLGQRSIQVFRAKRERVFDGWDSSYLRQYAASKLGNRLFVTGDVPPQDLFLSHNDLMHISGLPPTVTLQDLATFFQPFSADSRDVYGSSHIVRCSQGKPTGTAYVGFELPGEIDEVIEMYKGKTVMIGGCKVQMTPVKDKLLRRGKRESARPARTIEQLNDDLYNWEKHVNPKDIKELEEKGISKDILDEAMRNLRANNRSFAGDDQAMPGERIYEDRPVGSMYKHAVRLYIKLLKECAPTKENPGMMYEAMFHRDQPVDLSVFEYEAERIKALRKRGI